MGADKRALLKQSTLQMCFKNDWKFTVQFTITNIRLGPNITLSLIRLSLSKSSGTRGDSLRVTGELKIRVDAFSFGFIIVLEPFFN